MNRKGVEDLLWNIILVLILLFVAGSVLMWMSGNASGKAIKAEVIAKQAALLVDSAKPGTTIFIKANVSVEGNKVIAFSENNKAEYDFFIKNKVYSKTAEGGTEISIT